MVRLLLDYLTCGTFCVYRLGIDVVPLLPRHFRLLSGWFGFERGTIEVVETELCVPQYLLSGHFKFQPCRDDEGEEKNANLTSPVLRSAIPVRLVGVTR